MVCRWLRFVIAGLCIAFFLPIGQLTSVWAEVGAAYACADHECGCSPRLCRTDCCCYPQKAKSSPNGSWASCAANANTPLLSETYKFALPAVPLIARQPYSIPMWSSVLAYPSVVSDLRTPPPKIIFA